MQKLALFDGDYFLYLATNPDKELDQEGQPVRKDNKFVYQSNPDVGQMITKVDNIIIDILNTIEAEWYLGFLTGGSFRYKINQDYKANRKGRVRPKYFKVLKEYLIDHWGFYIHNELEADDLVNIARNYYNKINIEDSSHLTAIYGLEPIIVSNDKDILNLEGVHYNPQKKRFEDTSEEGAIDYFWRSMIIGDVGDNIKGIPGKGEKFVEKLITQYPSGDLKIMIYEEYLEYFGEEYGINEFYKNYKSLKILDSYEGLELPNPIKYEKI